MAGITHAWSMKCGWFRGGISLPLQHFISLVAFCLFRLTSWIFMEENQTLSNVIWMWNGKSYQICSFFGCSFGHLRASKSFQAFKIRNEKNENLQKKPKRNELGFDLEPYINIQTHVSPARHTKQTKSSITRHAIEVRPINNREKQHKEWFNDMILKLNEVRFWTMRLSYVRYDIFFFFCKPKLMPIEAKSKIMRCETEGLITKGFYHSLYLFWKRVEINAA